MDPWRGKEKKKTKTKKTQSISGYRPLQRVDEVLEIDVVAVRPDVIVDEQVQLVFNPVFKDKRQDSCCQLQEKDDSQEHRELEEEEEIGGQKMINTPLGNLQNVDFRIIHH